jgi:Leucine-rich repeat (LRR) protein
MSYWKPNQPVEWARLLWFKYEVLVHFFRYAAWLEKHGYFIEETARKSDIDNWTLHFSEGLVSQSEDQFNSFVSQAPLRAVILVSALQRSLDDEANIPQGDESNNPQADEANNPQADEANNPQADESNNPQVDEANNPQADESNNPQVDEQTNSEWRSVLTKRVQFVNTDALLSAQETLLAKLNEDFGESSDFDFALKLLLLIGTEAQLSSLPINTVNLANEPHSSAVIGKLGAVATLEALNLSQTQISREGTGFLAKLANLRNLDLSDTRVMSSSLVPLRNLPRLEELSLAGTQVNDTSLATFGFLTGLKRLDLRNSGLVGSKDAIAKLLPDCRVIV